jgi:hypothetical protein
MERSVCLYMYISSLTLLPCAEILLPADNEVKSVLFQARLPSMPSSVLQVCENYIVAFILSVDCLFLFVTVFNRLEACRLLYEIHNCSWFH